MKESYLAEEAAELLGITKSNFLFRVRSLGINSIGRGRGYAASDVLRVGNYLSTPKSEKGIYRTNYQPVKGAPRRGLGGRDPINVLYREFIQRYMDENGITGPMSRYEHYNRMIYRCKEKDVKTYGEFLKEVIGSGITDNWKVGPKHVEIKAINEIARRIKTYGAVYDYMNFDPGCTFDDELIEKFNELKEERPLYDDRPVREIYKEAMLSIMYKYHYIDNSIYFSYKVASDGRYVEYFTKLDGLNHLLPPKPVEETGDVPEQKYRKGPFYNYRT